MATGFWPLQRHCVSPEEPEQRGLTPREHRASSVAEAAPRPGLGRLRGRYKVPSRQQISHTAPQLADAHAVMRCLRDTTSALDHPDGRRRQVSARGIRIGWQSPDPKTRVAQGTSESENASDDFCKRASGGPIDFDIPQGCARLDLRYPLRAVRAARQSRVASKRSQPGDLRQEHLPCETLCSSSLDRWR